MKKKIIYSALLIAVISIYPLYNYFSVAEGEEIVEKITEVKVRKDDLRITQLADGNLIIPSIDVLSGYDGVVTEMNYKIGNYVEKGDLIARLIPVDDLTEKWQQEATDYQRKLLNFDGDIQDKRIAIEKLESNLELEEKTYELMNEYPDMYSLNEKKNQETVIGEIKSDLNFAQKDLTALYNEYNIAKNEYESAKEEYEMSTDVEILAVQSGTILSMNYDIGSEVKANNTFASIGNKESAYVIAEVLELDMGLVEEGQRVILNFEIDFGKEYSGTVEYISPLGKSDNNGIISYEVKIAVDDQLNKTLDGLSALVEFVIKEKSDVVIIPNSAVKIVEGKQQVEVETENGSEIREIITGFTDGISTEVITGLTEGETIFIRTIK